MVIRLPSCFPRLPGNNVLTATFSNRSQPRVVMPAAKWKASRPAVAGLLAPEMSVPPSLRSYGGTGCPWFIRLVAPKRGARRRTEQRTNAALGWVSSGTQNQP